MFGEIELLSCMPRTASITPQGGALILFAKQEYQYLPAPQEILSPIKIWVWLSIELKLVG